jgi:glycosyltransferase involved in cell wall biosynthesis
MQALNGNVHYGPNVADTALFAEALEDGPIDPQVAALPGPRIVFVGAILAAKIDIELVVALARMRPQWSFAFVGPVGPGDPRTDVHALGRLNNVHMLGFRPYEQLPSVLRGADAAIVPYLLDGEMRSVFPMKIYEYLAAGRPVVSTPLDTLVDVPDVIKASDAEQFAARLQDALERDTPEERRARSTRAQAHSWESRLDQIAAALESADASGPKSG